MCGHWAVDVRRQLSIRAYKKGCHVSYIGWIQSSEIFQLKWCRNSHHRFFFVCFGFQFSLREVWVSTFHDNPQFGFILLWIVSLCMLNNTCFIICFIYELFGYHLPIFNEGIFNAFRIWKSLRLTISRAQWSAYFSHFRIEIDFPTKWRNMHNIAYAWNVSYGLARKKKFTSQSLKWKFRSTRKNKTFFLPLTPRFHEGL